MLARIRFALSQCTQSYRWGFWNIGRIGVGYWKHILVVDRFGSGRSWNVFDRVFPGSLFTLRYLWEFWVFCLRNKMWQGKLCIQEIKVYFFPTGCDVHIGGWQMSTWFVSGFLIYVLWKNHHINDMIFLINEIITQRSLGLEISRLRHELARQKGKDFAGVYILISLKCHL